MTKLLALFAIAFSSALPSALCQTFTTVDGFTGPWEDGSSWLAAAQPDPLSVGINDNIAVYGYITANSSLDFAANNETKSIIIYDTLVVQGSMYFNNKAMELVVEEGGLLVIFGDFSATNKISIANGGTVVITGDMTFSPSGQDSFANTGDGKLYVDGSISGNNEADAVDQPTSDLSGSSDPGEQALFNFISSSGDVPLPIVLSFFNGIAARAGIELEWETFSEENFDYFELQRSGSDLKFSGIAKIVGNGFTSIPHQYHHIDRSPLHGVNYYRLNAVDYDGSSEIFKTIKVEFYTGLTSINIYPNPCNGSSFTVAIPEELFLATSATLNVTDPLGRLIFSTSITSRQTVTYFPEKLNTGLYMVSLHSKDDVAAYRLLVE